MRRILNNTEQTLKISQIILKATSGFTVKGKIDPSKLNTAGLKYAYSEDEAGYVMTLPEEETRTKEEIFAQTDFSVGGETATQIALNCDNYVLADKAEVTAYMIVPARAADTDVSVTIIVVDENGESKQVTVMENGGGTAIKSVGISKLAFSRGKTNPVFGFNTDGKTMKALDIKAANLADADGYYIDNKADLMALLNTSRGAVKVYNSGDLCIDEEVANAISKYTGTGIEFVNPIVIKSTAAATRTSVATELAKVTFGSNATMESGNFAFGDEVVLKATKTLEVKGGTLTLNNGTFNNTTSKVIIDGGEVNVAKENLAFTSVEFKNGELNINEKNAASKLNVTFTEGKDDASEINVNADLSLDASLTIGKKTTLNNAATITVNGSKTLTNNGTLNNGETGVIKNGGASSALVNNNKIVNRGVINPATITNEVKGNVENYKWFGLDATSTSTVANKGLIVLKDSNARVEVTSGTGEVDNSVLGVVTGGGAATQTSMTITSDMTDDEVIETLGAFSRINIKNCKWTLTQNFDFTASSQDWTNAELVLDGATLSINDVTLTAKNIVVKGASRVVGRNAGNSILVAADVRGTAALTAEFATVTVTGNAGEALNGSATANEYIYLGQTAAITGTGTAGKSTTLGAFAAQGATMTKAVYAALTGSVKVGRNVTLTITNDAVTTGFTNITKPTNATAAEENTGLMAAIVKGITVNGKNDLVSTDGGTVKVKCNITFSDGSSSTVVKYIIVTWDESLTTPAWKVTEIE